MPAKMKWSIINKKLQYDGFFKLSVIKLQHDLFAGGRGPVLRREVIDKGNAVSVLPYDPVRDEVVLVEQFRIGAADDSAGPWCIEVIAGYQEPGETAEEVVIREAVEEAGCVISKLESMYRFYSSPGGTSEQVEVFFARTDTSGLGGIHGLDEEGEDIKVHVVSSQQALAWLDSGRINSAMPIVALQWFRANRDRIRRQWS